MTTYRYLSADDWGATWTRPPVPERLDDPEVYVHHTAGNPYDTIDAVEAFQILNRIAQQGKGYRFLDYDDLVHYNRLTDVCTIGEGRGRWLSAATLDRNELGEAVCAFGYFHPPVAGDPSHYSHRYSAKPHPAIVEGIARAIVKGIQEGRTAATAAIYGHRDNPAHPNATGCPGDYLYAQMPTIRRRVVELLTPTPDPQPEVDPMLKFFRTPASSTAVWYTTDGITAIRLTAETRQARRAAGHTDPIVSIDADEAARYEYVNSIHKGAIGL